MTILVVAVMRREKEWPIDGRFDDDGARIPTLCFFFVFFCSLMEVDDEILFCRDVFSFLHSGNLSLYFVNDVSRVFVGLVSEIDSKNLIFLSY